MTQLSCGGLDPPRHAAPKGKFYTLIPLILRERRKWRNSRSIGLAILDTPEDFLPIFTYIAKYLFTNLYIAIYIFLRIPIYKVRDEVSDLLGFESSYRKQAQVSV